jgi:hypothetical protein
MKAQVFYLSSLDSERLELPRECVFNAGVVLDSGRSGVLATVAPPIPGADFDVPGEITEVFITNRHEGDSIDSIAVFPLFVYVARLRNPVQAGDAIPVSNIEIIGWGELYRTQKDAEEHVFDEL